MSEKALRVWIADDEALIRRSILRTLGDQSDVLVVGESTSVRDTVTALRTHSIDLLLLDVQMHEGSGFDVVAQIGPETMPAVIFITAHDQYAIRAFEVAACDYLLKPFDGERLSRSIDRARELITARRGGILARQLEMLLAQQAERWPERLAVRSGERIDLVSVEKIDSIESANNYVVLHCGTRQYTMAETLTGLTAKLDPKRFMRVHRGRIVNTSKIVAIHPMFSGTYELELRGGLRIATGRLYKAEIQKLFSG